MSASDDRANAGPVFSRPGDNDDAATLPGEFRAFRAETRTSFELLTERLIPFMTRIDGAIQDIAIRITKLEQGHEDVKRRVEVLEANAAKRRRASRK